MSIPLRPLHFVSRPDGKFTALVAVDELPSFISIRGIPRVLDQNGIEGMISLGTLPDRGQKYTVDVSQDDAPEPAPLHQRRSWRNSEPVEPAGREVVKHTASVEANSPKSSGEKKFCTHFVRKNQCDYRGQGKGCKYQHEFVEGHPDTREMLKLFGLSEIPPWCRVKENDKSITPSAGNPLPARVWRPESREHSVPQGVPVEWTAPHCVASAGLDSAGRYASGSASPGHHHHHHHHHRQPHQSQPAARPRAQPQPQPQSAKDPYVLAGRSQFFRSLSHFDGEDVFSGIIPLQPTNRTERAVNHEVGVDGKSPWATQANQENINPNSMRFNSAAPEQTGNRGRRLYQPRTTNEVSQNQPRPMHEHNRRSDSAAGRHSAPIPQSASPPLGSRPPSRMSEVKQNNDHTQNHNMSMFVNMSEPSSANGLASRAATPDSNDPFGLIKFD